MPPPGARGTFAPMKTTIASIALAASLAACARDAQPGADTGATANPADQSTVIPPPSMPAITASADGAGPVTVGMTLAAARAALGLGADTATVAETCRYLDPGHAVHGVLFMVERDTVVRVDVRDSTVATPEGARIGDSESRIRQLYPTAVQQPHKYTGPTGHYLVVKPGADTTRQLIFETDGAKVTTWRAGKVPQVGYVEGCS